MTLSPPTPIKASDKSLGDGAERLPAMIDRIAYPHDAKAGSASISYSPPGASSVVAEPHCSGSGLVRAFDSLVLSSHANQLEGGVT